MRLKKFLTFENAVNTSSALLVQENEMLSHMNVEDLPNDGVSIVFMNPSGNVTVRIPRDSQTKMLVKNRRTLLLNKGEKRLMCFQGTKKLSLNYIRESPS